jgi:hypothetical protein
MSRFWILCSKKVYVNGVIIRHRVRCYSLINLKEISPPITMFLLSYVTTRTWIGDVSRLARLCLLIIGVGFSPRKVQTVPRCNTTLPRLDLHRHVLLLLVGTISSFSPRPLLCQSHYLTHCSHIPGNLLLHTCGDVPHGLLETNDFQRNLLDIEILSNLRFGSLEIRDTSVTRTVTNNHAGGTRPGQSRNQRT